MGSKLSQKESEQTAIQWFQRFNHRAPNDEELSKIKAFVQTDAKLTAQEFLVPVRSLNFDAVDDDDSKQSELPIASTTKGVVTKDRATGYTLSFGDDEKAIKWFERFNNRRPSDDELQHIHSFLNLENSSNGKQLRHDDDDDDMIDIE